MPNVTTNHAITYTNSYKLLFVTHFAHSLLNCSLVLSWSENRSTGTQFLFALFG